MEKLATKTAVFWDYFNHLMVKNQLLKGDDFNFEACESLDSVVFASTKKLLSIKHLVDVVERVNGYYNTGTTFEDLVQSPYFLAKVDGQYYFDVAILQNVEQVRLFAPVAPKQKLEFLDCLQTVDLIKGMVKHREIAINYYPNAKTYPEQNDAISRLKLKLEEINFVTRDCQKARLMLRMEIDLLFIAPRSTIKIFTTHVQKVNAIMCLLREVLGLKKQS